MKNDKKYVIFKVDDDFHKKIKILAARCNVSMNLLIIRALEKYIKEETKFDKE